MTDLPKLASETARAMFPHVSDRDRRDAAPMTTADAKVELVRKATWRTVENIIDVLVEREMVDPNSDTELLSEQLYEALHDGPLAKSALEAPHSMTEAITDEMIEAGIHAEAEYLRNHDARNTSATAAKRYEAIYTAMQSARLIDLQNEGVPASPSGCQPLASAAEEASSRSGIPNAAIHDRWRTLTVGAHVAGDDWAVRYLDEHFILKTEASNAIPRDVREQVLSMGRVEWGATDRLTSEGRG